MSEERVSGAGRRGWVVLALVLSTLAAIVVALFIDYSAQDRSKVARKERASEPVLPRVAATPERERVALDLPDAPGAGKEPAAGGQEPGRSVRLLVQSEDGVLPEHMLRVGIHWRPGRFGEEKPEVTSVEFDVVRGEGTVILGEEWVDGSTYQLTVVDEDRYVFNGPVVLSPEVAIMLDPPRHLQGTVSVNGQAGAGLRVGIKGRYKVFTSWQNLGETVTDEQGKFDMLLRPCADPEWYSFAIGPQESRPFAFERVPAVIAEATAVRLDVGRESQVVRVTDEAGNPVEEAWVWAMTKQADPIDGQTDAEGMVEIVLDAPANRVMAYADGFAVWEGAPGSGVDPLEVVLVEVKQRAIRGVVRGDDGSPCRAYVSAGPTIAEHLRHSPSKGVYSSEEDGSFELSIPEGQPFWVSASSRDYGDWGPEEFQAGAGNWVDVEFPPRGGVNLYVDGLPQGLAHESGPAWVYYCKREGRRAGHKTSYHFPAWLGHLEAGSYNLFVLWEQNDVPFFGQASVEVQPGMDNDIRVSMGIANSIDGVVTDAEGHGLSGERVVLMHPNWWGDPHGCWGVATSAANGAFSLPVGFLEELRLGVKREGDWVTARAVVGSSCALVLK